MNQFKNPLVQAVVSGLVITGVALAGFIRNINQIPIFYRYEDTYLLVLTLKHYYTNLISGNLSQLPNLPIFWGYTNTLFYTETLFIQSLLSIPFALFFSNPFTIYNLTTLLLLLLSFCSMFWLVHFLTRNSIASIIGASIYIFNSYVMSHFPFIMMMTLCWIPLIFLLFEKFLRQPSNKYGFWFFIILTLQMLSYLYYSAFLTLVLPIYIGIRIYQTKFQVRKFLNTGSWWGAVIFIATLLLLVSFYLQSAPVNKQEHHIKRIEQFYSATLKDWLTYSDSNLVYPLINFPFKPDEGIPFYWEKSLFPGVIAIFLLIASFVWYKGKKTSVLIPFYLLLGLSFLITLGPKIYLTSQFYIPGIYGMLYYLNPLFQFIRVPPRFAVFVMFFIALISAITYAKVASKLSWKKNVVFSGLVVGILILESINSLQGYQTVNDATRNFYQQLNSDPQIEVILELPIGNMLPFNAANARPEDFDTHYLVYQSLFHSKKLMNGFTTFYPPEYYDFAAKMSINFPTKEKLLALKRKQVDLIVLHQDEFNDKREFLRISEALKQLHVPVYKQSGDISSFSLYNWTGN